jgi:hypothetical protein
LGAGPLAGRVGLIRTPGPRHPTVGPTRVGLEVLVSQQAPVDGVRQPAFQAAQGFLGGLALGQLALVVGLAGAGSADLDHGHHVQRVIQLAVPGPRQPVADDLAARGLQWAVPVWAAK